jgi:hypothetical protein
VLSVNVSALNLSDPTAPLIVILLSSLSVSYKNVSKNLRNANRAKLQALTVYVQCRAMQIKAHVQHPALGARDAVHVLAYKSTADSTGTAAVPQCDAGDVSGGGACTAMARRRDGCRTSTAFARDTKDSVTFVLLRADVSNSGTE